MDKFMTSPWFIKIISLALALLLYISVSLDLGSSNNSSGFNTPAKNDKETIENVPVEINYDRENLVVSGAPKTVTITLDGPKSLLLSAKNQQEFKVYIDLSDPETTTGQKRVPIKIRDINEKIKVSIEPEYAEVSIQERITEEFTVEPEYNRSLLEEGYSAEKPTVNPQTVKITGGKDVIEKISYVKATIELSKGVNETVNRQAQVRALDRELNKLDVIIEPAVVDVTLKVNIPSKTVPIEIETRGKANDSVEVADITTDPKEITLYGRESVLESISNVKLPINISSVTTNTSFDMQVPMPEGVQKMSRDTVKVSIKTEKTEGPKNDEDTGTDSDTEGDTAVQVPGTEEPESTAPAIESKTLSNLKIEPSGLAAVFEMLFLSPSLGQTAIVLQGNSDDLKKVTAANVRLSIDVSKVEEGQHELPIQVNAPKNVKWELQAKVATVSITKKEEAT